MNFNPSIEYPAQTILSGPAASVMDAEAFRSEAEDTLVMDIGGTTTDLAVLIKGSPVRENQDFIKNEHEDADNDESRTLKPGVNSFSPVLVFSCSRNSVQDSVFIKVLLKNSRV